MNGWAGSHLSRNILKLAYPVFLGTIGVEALAAAGLAWFVVWVFGSSLMAIEVGTQSLVARQFGGADWEGCNGLLDNTLIFALFSGLLFSIAGYLLAPLVFPYFSEDEKVVKYGIDYMKYSSLDRKS